LHITTTHRSGFLQDDLECPIHLKVRLADGTLDVRLLRVSDSTTRIDVARGEEGEWLEGLAPVSCGQLTRCFSAVAELLVVTDSMGLSSFKFLQCAPKDASFLHQNAFLAVQGHPNSTILVPINRKRVCDFLLVGHRNYGPTLHISHSAPSLPMFPSEFCAEVNHEN